MKASNENNGLRVAEKVSVGASVAGTLAAIWSQQMIVAAAPLTLALSLNLINRGKFQQKLEDDITAIVSEIDNRIQLVDKEVSGEMRSLQSSVQDLSLASKNVESQPIKTEISYLQKQFVNLEEAFSNLSYITAKEKPEITQTLATFDPTYLEQQIVELKTTVIELEGIIYQNEQKDKIAQLQANMATLSADFKDRAELRQITELRRITDSIQQKITELPTTTASFEPRYLEQEIHQLKQNLVELKSDFKQRELQQLSDFRQITDKVQERLATLYSILSSFNASELEQEIKQLKNNLIGLKSEFKERELQQLSELKQITDSVQEGLTTLTHTTIFDASYLERDIKQLKDYFAGLSVQVKERSTPQEIAELKEIVESLQQNLAPQATESLTSKPEFDPSYLEQENQQLKSEIASLKQQLGTSNEQVAMIPQLFENFAQMQKQLQELQEKTEKISPKISQVAPSKPPELVQKKTDKLAISKFTESSSYSNSGKLSLASVLRVAEENGIGEEFKSILKIASQHQLTFDFWPTNLMISPPKARMLSVPTNCSKCLFLVSVKPSDEGKLKVWLSPNAIAKFYPKNQHNLSLIFGDEGWRELGKAELENFVATLNQLLG